MTSVSDIGFVIGSVDKALLIHFFYGGAESLVGQQ